MIESVTSRHPQGLLVFLVATVLLLSACGVGGVAGQGESTTEAPPAEPSTTISEPETIAGVDPTTSPTTTTTTLSSDLASAPLSAFPVWVQDEAVTLIELAEGAGLPLVAPLQPLDGFAWSVDVRVTNSKPGGYRYDLLATAADGSAEYEISFAVRRRLPSEPTFEDRGIIPEPTLTPVGGFPIHVRGSLEELEFFIVTRHGELLVILGVNRGCPSELQWTISDGICLTWEQLDALLHGLGIVE